MKTSTSFNLVDAVKNGTIKIGSTFQFVVDKTSIKGAGSSPSGGYTYMLYGMKAGGKAFCRHAFSKTAREHMNKQIESTGSLTFIESFDNSKTIESLKNAIFTVTKINDKSITVEATEWNYEYVDATYTKKHITSTRKQRRIPFNINPTVEIHNIN